MSTPDDSDDKPANEPEQARRRFSPQERAELVGASELAAWSAALLKRSEGLRFYELSDDPYEVSIFEDYLSQVGFVNAREKKLIDLKLERNVEEAERTSRQIEDAHELMEALLGELTRIIDWHYREHIGLS